jgi:hypothetical protein
MGQLASVPQGFLRAERKAKGIDLMRYSLSCAVASVALLGLAGCSSPSQQRTDAPQPASYAAPNDPLEQAAPPGDLRLDEWLLANPDFPSLFMQEAEYE